MKKICNVCIAVAVAVAAKGDIHDDAVVWLRGDSDLNGDGRIQVGEIVDALSPVATDAIKPNGWLDGTVSGRSGDFVWTNDTVVCPYSFRTNENAKCYCFSQSRNGNNIMPNTISMDSSIVSKITSNAWSFFIRFKWKGEVISPDKTTACQLAYIGSSSTAVDGHGFSMYLTKDGKLTCGIGSTYFITYNTLAISISSNVWTDAVFTMTSSNIVEWSVMQAGGSLVTGSCSPGDLNFRPDPEGMVVLGNHQVRTTWAYYYSAATANNAFIGEVAEFAIWNRALSPEDRLRAMSWPNEDIFRVGIADGSPAEFDGEGGVADSALYPDCGWGAFGGDIVSGASKSVAFFVPVRFNGLTQLLRYKAAEASAGGTFSLSANGETVGTFDVRAGQWSHCMVPGRYFTGGETTMLTLTRTDSGEDAVKTDALALGGSWQEGTVSGNQWENSTSYAQATYYLPDGNFKHFREALHAGQSQNVLFDVADDVVARYRFKFAYVMQIGKVPAHVIVRAYLNGRLIYEEYPTAAAWAWVSREIKIPAAALVAGKNILTFANEGDNSEETGETKTYISFDYLQLLVDKEVKGLAIIFR